MPESYVPGYRFPLVAVGPKPRRGDRVLAKEQADAEAAKIERIEKGKAKARDGRCRWPEAHKCRLGLEAAHIVDASLGGPMDAENLVTFCGWIHRRGPETIHNKDLMVEKETERGAWGPLSFWRRTAPGEYYMVKRETAPFQYEKD
jgi:hypothetical protein